MDLLRAINFPIEKGFQMYSLIRNQDDQGISRPSAVRTAFSLDEEVIDYFLKKGKEKKFDNFVKTIQNIYGFDAKAFYKVANKKWSENKGDDEFLGRVLHGMVCEMYEDQMLVSSDVFKIQYRAI